ncbi:MAG: hypothetical protein PHR77_02720 [Kiritimatiellae bacterium]|nr:hypothetical protein [Kiritimatiellia bacterium]MDD5523254.1 hypothetical protein [Kiritimatiellia bacterium]
MDVDVRDIISQRSWVISNDQVKMAVTMRGAHMAPVVFDCKSKQPIQPYYISPWQGGGLSLTCRVLVPLRGDFFCLPFGGNATPFKGENHPPHGEVSGSLWTLFDSGRKDGLTTLTLDCETSVRPGRVTQQFSLVDDHNVVYNTTTIDGFMGKTPMGHHAILAMPKNERSVLISMSPFKFGMTCPHPFSQPANREYQALAFGAEVSDLSKVPTIFNDPAITDCSSYPARLGYADMIGLFDDPASSGTPSWAVAVNTAENWLWYSLKNPAEMPARLIWMENHGRHGSPWDGRNCCMALEDGCLYFDAGVAESSAPNIISKRGIPTCHDLKAGVPFSVRYIQGVARVPSGFGRVKDVKFGKDQATFISENGQKVAAKVRHTYLKDGKL